HRVHAAADLAGGEGDRRGHVGLDEAGRDRVHGDALAGVGVGVGVHQPDDAGLGGAVVGLAPVAGDARDGRDVDDAAAVAEHAQVHQLLGQLLRGQEVDAQHGVPAAGVHVGQKLVAGDTGVVDQHVEAAALLRDRLGDLVGGVLGGDVHGQRGAPDLVG